MTLNPASVPSSRKMSCDSATSWCSDASTRDNVIARRNALAGLWPSRLMQTPDHLIQRYAAAVQDVDFCETGDDDVVDKLFGDLTLWGVAISREEVRLRLCDFYRQAIAQARETD